jgi:phosphoribosylaminoimidazole carboxylase (NCAIR synthetase)
MWIEALSKKIRFEYKGKISIEDLFDLSLNELDEIYRNLKKELDEYQQYSADSLLDKDVENDEAYDELQLKIDVVTAVFNHLKKQQEELQKKIALQNQRDKILGIIADKQDEELTNKSISELKEILNNL